METKKSIEKMPLKVSPKSATVKWVTLDTDDKIISEGSTPEEAVADAKKKTDDFFLMFIPQEGNTYIF